ncbi:MAG: hypothetical protein AB1508_19175 [Pseudomonadota bacterium]
MIGYKLLREDGSSLREVWRYQYELPANGGPGSWQVVPGNGAYLAVTGGLSAGGVGPQVARLESPDDEPDVCESGVAGVRCRRTVRVLGAWPLVDLPPEIRADVERLGVRFAGETGEHVAERNQTLVVLRGAPTVYVGPGGRCQTCGRSAPTVCVAAGGLCDTHDRSAPTVHVARGGWCGTCDRSAPTVQVAAGGLCETCDESAPTVQVALEGSCYTRDRSRPTLHVAAGGWCETCDESAPTVQVARKGSCYTRDRSRPTVQVAREGSCYTCDRSAPTVHVAAGGRCQTYDDSTPTVIRAEGVRPCGRTGESDHVCPSCGARGAERPSPEVRYENGA